MYSRVILERRATKGTKSPNGNQALCLSQFQLGTSPCGGLAEKSCHGARDLTLESCPGTGNSTRAGILWKFKVKCFVYVLVLLVINTGCPKNS